LSLTKKSLAKIEKIMDKKYGDPAKPMLLKLVLAPNLQFSTYPSIHNIGLTTTTMEGFGKNTGEKFRLW
jgi:pyruvate,orthophosphate dikinase